MGVVKQEEVYQHYHFIIADVEDEGEGEQTLNIEPSAKQ